MPRLRLLRGAFTAARAAPPAWALCLLLGAAGGRAEVAAPDRWEPRTEVAVAVVFNDNALLGRRGQYLAPRVGDLYNLLRLRHESGFRLASGTRLVGIADLSAALLRSREELRAADLVADLSLEQALGDTARMVPEIALLYHPEASADWSFWLVRPRVRFELPPWAGVLTEVGYQFEWQDFAGSTPRLTFGNLDNRGHLGELHARYWIGDFLRLALTYRIAFRSYASSLNGSDGPFLRFVGLPPGTERHDLAHALEGEVLFAWGDRLTAALGYRFEDNLSNSPAFTFRMHRLAAVIYWEITGQHVALLEGRLGRYDFHRYRFDERYVNTREDLRLDLVANYRFVFNETFHAQIRYALLFNDSNDAIDFDPRTSLSYSTFYQNRVELLVAASF